MTPSQVRVARVGSASVRGIEGYVVSVEVDLAKGVPVFTMVGLPDAAVRESRERVRAAVRNCDMVFPLARITVNLAPADVRKEGPKFDLPVAIALLAASRQLPAGALDGVAVIGELSLTGEIRPVNGILPAALALKAAGFKSLLLPAGNAPEAAVVRGLAVHPASDLLQCVAHLEGSRLLPVARPDRARRRTGPAGEADFAEVRGQVHVKRALEIAAAGGHNLLMIGPPGSGKTMLARRLPGILPPLTHEEALEITKIHSVAGTLPPGGGLVAARPFRAPHHTISDAGLVGGGSTPHVGEVSLAHLGVLFLDELPEFKRHVLEVLRQPLEDGRVSIVRAGYSVEYPARVALVAAMNPCPCGNLMNPVRACRCSPQEIRRYHGRISGPLLDRIDLNVEVPAVPVKDISGGPEGEPSSAVAARVVTARRIQAGRLKGTHVFTNAQMGPKQVRRACTLDDRSQELLSSAMEQFGLSARAYDRVLKVSRTIADLAGVGPIGPEHVAEALQYRALDRTGW